MLIHCRTAIDFLSSFVATRHSSNNLDSALAAPKVVPRSVQMPNIQYSNTIGVQQRF